MANLLERTLSNIKKESLLSVSNILVMTVTFFLLGVFIFVVATTQTALKYLEKQAQVTAFFKDDFTEQSILDLKKKYEADVRVKEIAYLSKEEAYKIFTEMNKDEPTLLQSVSASILPASLEFKTKNLADLSGLADELSKTDGVEEVKFLKDVIDRFRFWSMAVFIGGFSLVTVFLLISFTIVITTLRTAINSKGTELEIMKLVGASDSYVKSPFIFLGVLFGIISSFIAGLLVLILGITLRQTGIIPKNLFLGFIYGFEINSIIFTFLLWFMLLLFGVFLGWLGSYTAIKKYLNY